MGEQRSPKKAPDKIAPPVNAGLIPIAFERVMQITPRVAAAPKDVPVRNETRQHSRKVIRIKTDGIIILDEWYMINGMVPQSRHTAVNIPISTNVIKMFFTVFIPVHDIFRMFAVLNFLINP